MTIANVFQVAAGSTDTNNVTTANRDSSGCTLLVAKVTVHHTLVSGLSIADSKGNSYNVRTSYNDGAERVIIYDAYGSLTLGSGHNFQVTSTTGYPTVEFFGFSGTDSNPFDQQTGNGSSGGNTMSPGSITPGGNDYLFFTGVSFYDGNFGVIPTVDSGFSSPIGTAWTSGQSQGGASAYKIASGSGAENPTWTMGGGQLFVFGAVTQVTYKAAPAGTTISPAQGTVVVDGKAPTIAVTNLQTAAPIADIASNGWQPSSGGDLYAMLNEAQIANASNYIFSPNNPTTQQFEVKLSPLNDPASSANHAVNIGMQAEGLDTTFDFDLVQGTTILDSWSEAVTVAQGHVVRSRTFSGTVADNISDYNDLRIRGVARAP